MNENFEPDNELSERIKNAIKNKSENGGGLSPDRNGDKNEKQDKKKKKKWSAKKKVLVGLLIFLIVVLLLLGAAFLFIMSKLDRMNLVDRGYDNSIYESISEAPIDVENPNSEPDTPESEMDNLNSELDRIEQEATELKFSEDVLNVLLIGTDARTSNYRGRSDSMILVSINQETKEIVMTSIMRDTYVTIPGKNKNRINAAYAYGGADLLIQTVEANFGVRIDKFVQVDFTSFVDVIEAVGGVEIELNEREVEYMNKYHASTDPLVNIGGDKYLLDGKQALTYARIRYIGNADFERTQRQRRVLEEIIASAKELSIIELSDSLDVILPYLTTDFTKGELLSLILDSVEYFGYDRIQHRVPDDGTFWNIRLDGRAMLGIDFEENRKILIEKIYGE